MTASENILAPSKKAMHTYDKLIAIRNKGKGLRIGFLTTIMNENQDDLDEIFRFLASKGPDNIGLNMIRGVPGERGQLDVDIGKYENARQIFNKYNFGNIGKQFSFAKLRMIKTLITQERVIDIQKRGRSPVVCPAGDKIAVLYSDGNISACELKNSVIGDLREHDHNVKTIWRTEKRKKICRGILDSKCCCTHECFITAGQIFEIKGLLGILSRALFRNKRHLG